MAEKLNMVEALNLALSEELSRDENVILLGEDVGADGGIFRVSADLVDKFGEGRVLDTPLAESVIVGASVGMAINGLVPVAELQFSGFSYYAFHQIEGHVARYRWRTGGGHTLPMVIRMPYGGGVRALEHHSESREVYFAHTPGLRTVIPSSPRAACGLLKAAIRDPDPVIFLEPKATYRAFREEVDVDEEPWELDKARTVRTGDDLTMISYGAMLHRTLEAADVLEKEDDVTTTVIDLQTIAPLDRDSIAAAVRATGRVVIVTEAPHSYGPGAGICAEVTDAAFLFLEAPPARVSGYDIHMPFFAREQAYLPDVGRIVAAARSTLEY